MKSMTHPESKSVFQTSVVASVGPKRGGFFRGEFFWGEFFRARALCRIAEGGSLPAVEDQLGGFNLLLNLAMNL
jgi:hypothetical protein